MQPYDFQKDVTGEVVWYELAYNVATQNSLYLKLPEQATNDQVFDIIKKICNKFKFLLEETDLREALYFDEHSPKYDTAAQLLFYGITLTYCEINQLPFEVDIGPDRGPVSFKIGERTYPTTVITKLTSNRTICNAYRKLFDKKVKTRFKIFLAIDVTGGNSDRIEILKKMPLETDNLGKRYPKIIFINARKKLNMD